MTTIKLNSDYCRNIVKDHDYDRYLVSLCANREDQKHLWALFAFNHEIAKTKEIVTEKQLGLIRLQWWREEIAKIYNDEGYKDNHVLPALADAIKEKGLGQEMFNSLLDAREHDLNDSPYNDIDSLISYADCTNTPLLMLTAQICGVDIDYNSLTNLGIAYGLAGLIMSVPYRKKDFLFDNLKEVYEEGLRNLDVYSHGQVPLQPLKSIAKITKLNLAHIKSCRYDPSHKNYTKSVILKALRASI